MIYLLHFQRKYKHAGHYMGFVDGSVASLRSRLKRHRAGFGARLLEVITRAGITFQLARVWRGEGADRNEERRMKKGNHVEQYCPICKNSTRIKNNQILRLKEG